MEDAFDGKENLAFISVISPVKYHGLLIALALLFAWIIPGFYLRNKYLRENKILPKI